MHHRGLKCKSRKSGDTWNTGKYGLGVKNEAGERLRRKGKIYPPESRVPKNSKER